MADLAGTDRLDRAVPVDLRGELADELGVDVLEVTLANGSLGVEAVGEEESSPLLPLMPVQFFASRFGAELRFHRDAHGKAHAPSVQSGDARAYYRRERASQD